MKLWSAFYDLAVPDTPGCPFEAMDAALRQAATSFCEQSLAWKYEHPSIPVTIGIASYGVVAPAEAMMHAIIHAEFDGKEINSRIREADTWTAGWSRKTGMPEYIFGAAPSVTLVPVPDVAGTLSMTIALKPSPTAAGIDDFIFNEYREAIVHGALARLMLSPRKPYTNAQLAQYHSQQFLVKTADAGMRVARSYTRAPLRTRIMGRT
ncbi:hypothetical protein [Nitrosovibrio tenuis]|uniref:Uncharacterized protein n=1 Tax=Nitrosovibrio tenuis TaxID=1233 RepID=A0A1H7IRL7_9PROT|nr:hypothetical protein [Nitrosovibrio tenuis]SEK64357.1 hypothetical protein SAMN05216387_102254 [Nitrosovibrio tenuis]